MTKFRLLIISVIILTLLNVGLIAVLMLGHSPQLHHKKGPKNIIIEKLHFDETQISKYEVLIKAHRASIKIKEDEMRAAKSALFSLLKNENQEEKNERIAQITIIQKDIEEIHFNHFSDIKELCKPNQVKDFNILTNELAKIFAPHKQPKRK